MLNLSIWFGHALLRCLVRSTIEVVIADCWINWPLIGLLRVSSGFQWFSDLMVKWLGSFQWLVSINNECSGLNLVN